MGFRSNKEPDRVKMFHRNMNRTLNVHNLSMMFYALFFNDCSIALQSLRFHFKLMAGKVNTHLNATIL